MKVRVLIQRAIFFARDSRFCLCAQANIHIPPSDLTRASLSPPPKT